MKVIEHEIVKLDDTEAEHFGTPTTFNECVLVYSGGPVNLNKCHANNCQVHFEGSAAATLTFIKMLSEMPSALSLIQNTFPALHIASAPGRKPMTEAMHGKYVLAHYAYDNWNDDVDPEGCKWVVVRYESNPDEEPDQDFCWTTFDGESFQTSDFDGFVELPTMPPALTGVAEVEAP